MRECRPQAVADLVQHRSQQVSLARSLRYLFRRHHVARQWQYHVVHARVHEVLKEDFFTPLLLVNTRVIWQIVCYRLISMAEVPVRKGASTTSMGVSRPRLDGRSLSATGSASCISATYS